MNNVFTKSVPLEQLQGLAVEVLAMPELCAFTRDLAGHAPDGVLPLLWTLRPGGETSAAAWRQAVMLLDRIARVLQVDEIDPFDHAAVGDVEAGNDAGADGHVTPLSPR